MSAIKLSKLDLIKIIILICDVSFFFFLDLNGDKCDYRDVGAGFA